ncbi:hypothetical protein H4R34_004829, partial [Dimargaris verticillata]
MSRGGGRFGGAARRGPMMAELAGNVFKDPGNLYPEFDLPQRRPANAHEQEVLTLMRDYKAQLRTSPFYLDFPPTPPEVERYSDRYNAATKAKGTKPLLKSLGLDVTFLPAELHPTVSSKKSTAARAKQVTVDGVDLQALDTLENAANSDDADDKEEAKAGEDPEIEIEEEEEDVEEENDYVVSYFDNGEGDDIDDDSECNYVGPAFALLFASNMPPFANIELVDRFCSFMFQAMLQTPTKNLAGPTEPLASPELSRGTLSQSPTQRPCQTQHETSVVTPRRTTPVDWPHTPSGAGPPPGTFTSPIATPFIQRLNGMELQWRLRDAYRMLREKDDHLALAAELGQNLLAANEQLKSAYDLLVEEQSRLLQAQQAHPPPTVDYGPPVPEPVATSPSRATKEKLGLLNDFVGELEQANADLHIKLDEANQALKEKSRQSHKEVNQLQRDLQELHQTVETLTKQNATLNVDKQRLVRDKTDMSKSLKAMTSKGAETEALQGRIDALEHSLATALQGKAELDHRHQSTMHELEELRGRCLEYQAQITEYDEERAHQTNQLNRAHELEQALDEAQEMVQILSGQLEEIQAKQDECGITGATEVKTLLTEVDDQRRDLQSKHDVLHQRHHGLVKAHSFTVRQQERMRHHIARLTQLTHQPSQEDRLRRLEQILGQTQSENQQLQRKLDWLERSQGENAMVLDCYEDEDNESDQGDFDDQMGSYDLDEMADDPESRSQLEPRARRRQSRQHHGLVRTVTQTNEMLHTLRARLDQLTLENDQLRQELRTSQMLRMSESEKLVQMESTLQERDTEIQAIRSRFTQLKFEYDEVKTKLQAASALANPLESASDEPMPPKAPMEALKQQLNRASRRSMPPAPSSKALSHLGSLDKAAGAAGEITLPNSSSVPKRL